MTFPLDSGFLWFIALILHLACGRLKGTSMYALGYVHEIILGNVKAFIIEGEKTVLVDTGVKPVPEEILSFFEKGGIKLGDAEQIEYLKRGSYSYIMNFIGERRLTVDTIICTHYHTDHTGCLKELKETLKVPVAMHPLDIPIVEGRVAPPPSTMLPPKLAAHFTVTPCQVDIPVHHEQLFTPDLRIIHVEGHTAGNLCLLFKDEVLLAGDSIMGRNLLNPLLGPHEINPPLPNASLDQEKALSNLKKLLDYRFTVILPSHGEPIRENAQEKLKNFVVSGR